MVRTSFSTLVRESYDFSCVITDAAGQSLVQASESIPSFIGTLPETVKHFLRFFPPDQLAPGDVLITNDIWLGTGHLPDITLAKPIFLRRQAGRLQRHDGARARHRRQDQEPRAARGLRGGAADPADEDDRRRQDRRDAGRHHPQERAHARPDDGRSVGPGRGARPDGRPAAQPDGRLRPARSHRPRARDPGPLRDGDARGDPRAARRHLSQRAQDRRPDGHADHAQDGAHHQGRRDRDGFRRHRRARSIAPSTARFATPTPWRCTG